MLWLMIAVAFGYVIPLNNYLNILYTLSVGVGTPSQNFELAINTLSPVTHIQCLWLNKNTCSPCHSYNRKFDPTASKTFLNLKTELTLKVNCNQFKSGIVDGTQSEDYVTLGDQPAILLNFLLATRDYDLNNLHADGAIGLGPVSSNGIVGYVQALYLDNKISQPFFALFFSDDGFNGQEFNPPSALILDEVILSYSLEEQGVSIVLSQEWKIGVSGIIIDNRSYSIDQFALIDSSATLIYGPKSIITAIFQDFIALYGCGFEIQGLISCECNNLDRFSNITFILAENFLTLSPANYFLKVKYI